MGGLPDPGQQFGLGTFENIGAFGSTNDANAAVTLPKALAYWALAMAGTLCWEEAKQTSTQGWPELMTAVAQV